MVGFKNILASLRSDSTREEDRAWGTSYKKAVEAKPSWSKHGLPALFNDFINLVKKSKIEGTHLDIGCGSGVKTVIFAKEGLNTVGVDQSDDGFEDAYELIDELKVKNNCRFIRADALNIPLPDQSVASISDILMFTHLKPKYWKRYETELGRLLRPGGYMLFVLFSDKDAHFHGHKVSKRYSFKYNSKNALMEGFEHYHGMYNTHFDKDDIKRLFNKSFKIIKMIEVQHPVYPHRKLWNVIFQKSPEE